MYVSKVKLKFMIREENISFMQQELKRMDWGNFIVLLKN